MNQHERHELLTTGRSAEFRDLVLGMTNDPDELPTKTELRAALAEVYPGAGYAELREAVFGKLVKIAEARAAGMNIMELRGVADEYVLKVEKEVTDADRLLPGSDEEEIDSQEMAQAILDAEELATRGPYAVEQRKAAEAAAAERRKLGL